MDQVTLIWDKKGRIAVQIEGDRVFDRSGNVIGWIQGDNVYDRDGRHVGWFIGGLLRDAYGKVLGFGDKIEGGYPKPQLPQEKEGAPMLSRQGPTQGKPGFLGRKGIPPIGGKPPLGASWSEFDTQGYFENH